MINKNPLVPFTGLGDIKLMSSLSCVRDYLKSCGVSFQQELWPNKGCNPEIPWTVIKAEGCITFFFAMDKLWKIYCEKGFEGSLPNGIRIGMTIQEAKTIDQDLDYDDWEEGYASKRGYWLEDNVDSGRVETMAIFIKPAMNDDEFFSYTWAVK